MTPSPVKDLKRETWLNAGVTETKFELTIGGDEYSLLGTAAGFIGTCNGRKVFDSVRNRCVVSDRQGKLQI